MPFFFILLFLAGAVLVGQNALIDQYNNRVASANDGTRQEGHNMRLYHQSAITYKAAITGTVGIFVPPLPGFLLTENRFRSCATGTTVVTYTGGVAAPLSGAENTGIVAAVLAETSNAQGIGLSNGVVINSGAGAFTPACPVPAGYAAIQTQVIPP